MDAPGVAVTNPPQSKQYYEYIYAPTEIGDGNPVLGVGRYRHVSMKLPHYAINILCTALFKLALGLCATST